MTFYRTPEDRRLYAASLAREHGHWGGDPSGMHCETCKALLATWDAEPNPAPAPPAVEPELVAAAVEPAPRKRRRRCRVDAATLEFGRKAFGALADEKVFAPYFRGDSWGAWWTLLRVLFGLPLSEDDLSLFERCTGRSEIFAEPPTKAWLLIGRRAGKSRVLALIAVMLACFKSYKHLVSPGERVRVMVLACDLEQAGIIFSYARSFITETAMLAPLLVRETRDTLELSNGVSIAVHTSSYKSVRGPTLAAALCDEVCFWRSEDSRNPAAAVLAALGPALGTIPGALLLCASSTYDRSGIAYETFEKHHGDDDSSVMVWRAPTRLMNPKFRQSYIDEAYASDPVSAAAEYDSEWRNDVGAFLDPEIIAANTVPGRRMLEKAPGRHYFAFADPSGGRGDDFTLAISHREEQPGEGGKKSFRAVLDVLEAVHPPFNPEFAIAKLSELLKSYGIREVSGDNYSGNFAPSRFAANGITYKPAELTRSELYLELLPLMMQNKVELLDVPQLRKQLMGLDRRTHSGGRDTVNHAPGSHDDLSNAAAGALVLAATGRPPMKISDAALSIASSRDDGFFA